MGIIEFQDDEDLFHIVRHAEVNRLKRAPENSGITFILDPRVGTLQVELLHSVLDDYFHALTIQK